MLTTFTNHKALFSLREISPRSKQMRCFHYVCMLLSLILSLGNVRWRVLLMCFATIALMFLSTECVASSISRWLGCKAEYYLLSCSTHSVLRLQRLGWMEAGGYPAFFFDAVTSIVNNAGTRKLQSAGKRNCLVHILRFTTERINLYDA